MGRSSSSSPAGIRSPDGIRLPRGSSASGGAGRAAIVGPRIFVVPFFLALLVSVLVPILCAPSIARAESADQVKAAFLFNFARYVEWPQSSFASDSDPLRLCVLGRAELQAVVEQTVSGRSVGNRPVEVSSVADLEATARCHLLFVGAGAGASAAAVSQKLGTAAVFTIADQPGFAAGGGIANFIQVDQKIRFEINPGAAKRAGLRISSSLLRLAKLVGEHGR